MSDENVNIPHIAILHIIHEVYEQNADGSYNPQRKDGGRTIITLKGEDKPKCVEKVKSLLEHINKEHANDQAKRGSFEPQRTGPNISQIHGTSGTQSQSSPLFGVRGGFAGHPSGPTKH